MLKTNGCPLGATDYVSEWHLIEVYDFESPSDSWCFIF